MRRECPGIHRNAFRFFCIYHVVACVTRYQVVLDVAFEMQAAAQYSIRSRLEVEPVRISARTDDGDLCPHARRVDRQRDGCVPDVESVLGHGGDLVAVEVERDVLRGLRDRHRLAIDCDRQRGAVSVVVRLVRVVRLSARCDLVLGRVAGRAVVPLDGRGRASVGRPGVRARDGDGAFDGDVAVEADGVAVLCGVERVLERRRRDVAVAVERVGVPRDDVVPSGNATDEVNRRIGRVAHVPSVDDDRALVHVGRRIWADAPRA